MRGLLLGLLLAFGALGCDGSPCPTNTTCCLPAYSSCGLNARSGYCMNAVGETYALPDGGTIPCTQ